MLVFTPLVLLVLGLMTARVAKARRVWRRHGLFPVWAGFVILLVHTVFSLGLLLSTPRAVVWAQRLGIADPTAWFIGAGLFAAGTDWPVSDPLLMAFVIVSFMLYPFWFWLGLNAGFWLFGRSPKQTGIIGLLR